MPYATLDDNNLEYTRRMLQGQGWRIFLRFVCEERNTHRNRILRGDLDEKQYQRETGALHALDYILSTVYEAAKLSSPPEE